MEIKSSHSLLFKKWLPIAGLIILTMALILFFKKKNLDEIVNEQEKSIAAFYTENLKPLFARTSVTKEDVYNFAFNNLIPLDKSGKQYFKLSDMNEKDNYFEFRNAAQDEIKNNDLADFENNLELNEKQKSAIDSILESYSGELENQILVNDKNTIAINYDLWDLNKAIKADVFRYLGLEQIEKLDKVTSLYSTLSSNPALDKMIAEARTEENDKFIFITPDTIFSHAYRFDEKELKRRNEEIERKAAQIDMKMEDINKKVNLKIAFNKILPKITGNLSKENIRLKMDNDFIRIEIPEIEIPEIDIQDLKDLEGELAELNESMKPFTEKPRRPDRTTPPKKSGGTTSYSYSAPDGYELNIDIPDIGEIVSQSLDAAKFAITTSGLSGEFADSLAELINASVEASMNDSMSASEKAEFKKEMEKMKKELKKLKYQNQGSK